MLKQRNKIFYVITSLDYGGTQKQLFYLLKNFPLETYFPVVISLKKGGRFLSKIEKVCSHIYSLGLPSEVSVTTLFFLPIAFVKFILLCLRYKPKIIHSFLFQANILAKLTKLFFWRTKIICSERVAEKQKLWQNVINKFTNFLVDKIVVNSKDLKNFVVKHQKVKPEKVVVIPNMIDFKEVKIKYTAEQLREILNLTKDTFIICSAGRLHKQKGYDLLLEVVKDVVTECNISNIPKNFVVIILGDGEEYKNLLLYTEKLGVSDYVKFLGYKENIYDYINMCNLFVLTSYWEGSPNVVLEALCLGKLVVSTSVEGVREILDDTFIIPLEQKREEIVRMFKEKILQIYKANLVGSFVQFKEKINLDVYFPEVVVKKYLTLYY